MSIIKKLYELHFRKRIQGLEDENYESETLLDVMIPYADLMTLLLIFFVFFYIISDIQSSEKVLEEKMEVIEKAKLDSLLKLNEQVITIPGEVLFETGDAELKEDAFGTLRMVAENIKNEIGDEENWLIRIEGHTDDVPISNWKFRSNWELSTARAVSLVRFFLENSYFDADQMTASGYGEFKPIVANDSPQNRRINRRVEIRLSRSSE